MNVIKRRLICLNLVLLLVLVLTLPVSGSQSTHAMTLHYNGSELVITAATQLPDPEDGSLLGWTSSASVSPTDLYQLPGIWFKPQSTVTPHAGSPCDLYAVPKGSGQYAVFDPTSGTVTAGGNLIVYGSVSPTDLLQIVTPDASAVQAPMGYTFNGWKLSGTIYNAGQALSIARGQTLQLQAQWKRSGDAVPLTNGLYLLKNTTTNKLQIFGATNAVTVIAATYEFSGQMQNSAAATVINGQVQLELPYDYDSGYCRVFTLADQSVPTDADAYFPIRRSEPN